MMNFEERQKAQFQKMQQQTGASTNNNGSKENQQEQKLTAQINIESCEMESLTKNKLITTRDLGRMVNKVFRTAMPEYEGSRVYPEGYSVVADIFFAERTQNTDFSNGKIKVLQRRDVQDKNGKRKASSIIDSYNSRNKTSNAYELTQQGRDALSEFIDPVYFKGNMNDHKIDWKKVTSEMVERVDYFNNSRALFRVKIDLRRLLSKIYGKKNGKSLLMYDITVCRPLNQMQDPATGNIMSSEYLLNIVQLDKDSLDKALNDAGFSINAGSLNINRD